MRFSDFWMALAILVSTVVLLQVANIIADGIAFYCLPGGQSTVLRHKRDELVSKKSEFAELGMKAALAATTYRAVDPDNNGALCEFPYRQRTDVENHRLGVKMFR